MKLSKTLELYAVGRCNNLNFIRIVAALAVLISHAYPLTLGQDALQPFVNEIGITLGAVAVYVFFIVSGFLISKSFEGSKSITGFVLARCLRIFPGLLMVLLLTVFILAPLTSTLSIFDLFTNIETITYIPRNLSLFSLQYELPGVFKSNPYPGAINGSLWSLLYEVICYGAVIFIGLAGVYKNNKTFLSIIFLYFCLYGISQNLEVIGVEWSRGQKIFNMSLPFFIGVIFYKFRRFIILNIWIGSLCFCLLLLTRHLNIPFEVLCLLLAYITFYLAYIPDGKIRSYNQLGDYSYGVYIYAFPVQQTIVYYLGDMTPLSNIVIATVPTLFLAILSWHFIENPSLKLRKSRIPSLRISGLFYLTYRSRS